MKIFALGIVLLSSLHGFSAEACRVTRSYGTNFIEAQGNCRGIIGGRVGSCGPMNAQGTYWYCECNVGCGGRGAFAEEDLASEQSGAATELEE